MYSGGSVFLFCCMNPWIQFPGLHNPDMVIYTSYASTQVTIMTNKITTPPKQTKDIKRISLSQPIF